MFAITATAVLLAAAAHTAMAADPPSISLTTDCVAVSGNVILNGLDYFNVTITPGSRWEVVLTSASSAEDANLHINLETAGFPHSTTRPRYSTLSIRCCSRHLLHRRSCASLWRGLKSRPLARARRTPSRCAP
jgi:hypothetical protein